MVDKYTCAPGFSSLEGLEQRLMLTTLNGGESLLYLNSQGQEVTITLVVGAEDDPADAQIELISKDLVAGMCDTVGRILDADGNEIAVVNWPAVFADPNVWDGTNWAAYDAAADVRGAQTEIFAIYVSAATSDTRIVIEEANGWSSTFVPTLEGDDADGTVISAAPADSGGVIVGAENYYEDLFDAAASGSFEAGAPALGVFPGGDLYAGITVVDDVDFDSIRLMGTLAGGLYQPGSLRLVDMGYLYGNVDIGENIGSFAMRMGGGAGDSVISIGGHAGQIESRGGTLGSAIEVGGNLAAPEVFFGIGEYEYYDAAGNLELDNNTLENAQIISHPTGRFTLFGTSTDEDWFALPLMAGQTINIDGLYQGIFEFTDADGNVLDTYGYETIEDMGLASEGYTTKPLNFTAPAAGVYYIRMLGGGEYGLNFTGGPEVDFGGVTVAGDLVSSSELPLAEDMNIVTHNGGNIGAIIATGQMSSAIKTFEGGDVVAVDATTFYSLLYGTGNIGSVRADSIYGLVEAGADSGFYSNNAYIQNIQAGEIEGGSIIQASGSIGVIEVAGNLGTLDVGGVTIRVNSDSSGPSARVDLIDIGGDLYYPSLYHGPGGNFGFINVGGIVQALTGYFQSELQPTVVNDGRTVRINDDGGGQLTVTPESGTTYQYLLIPVDDSVGGIGGAIANLTVNGSATLSSSGSVELTELVLTGDDGTWELNGSGVGEVYHLTTSGANPTVISNTEGDLVSANFSNGLSLLQLRGSLGAQTGSTGAWLFGAEAAPTSGDITAEPQYGWFHGRINGLSASGTVDQIIVGGSLGDVRVDGTIGTITVNSDGVTPSGQWHGVTGIVWSSGDLGVIQVGDGLADDGGAPVARAAIMSTGIIGSVQIAGPRYELDGRIFGELNGSILAAGAVVGTPAIGEIIGTRGAWLTAIVGATYLDVFRADGLAVYMSTGDVGSVSMTGANAYIYNNIIMGLNVGSVTTGLNAVGMRNVTINASIATPDMPGVGLVAAGGRGMDNVSISVNGGSIGQVIGLGANADILNSYFYSTDGMYEMRARHIRGSGVHMPGHVGLIAARGDITDLTPTPELTERGIYVGSVGRIQVAGSFIDNTLTVAGQIGAINIVDDFLNSYLTLQGPTVAFLQSLVVGGDISGAVRSSGQIGRIISRTGTISADIEADGNQMGASAQRRRWDVGRIEASDGITGEITVTGSRGLGQLIVHSSMGSAGNSVTHNIWGSLGLLRVGDRGDTSDFYDTINVAADIGTIDIRGGFYGNISANGNLGRLVLAGPFGGGGNGSLSVLGDIGALRFPATSDLAANLTTGGSIRNIALRGASITGDITSLHGDLTNVSVVGGSITGNLIAESFSRIVVDGDITGDIDATSGPIRVLTIRNGDLNGTVRTVDKLGLIRSVNATLSGTIDADGGIGSIISNGDITSPTIRSGGTIDRVVAGSMTGTNMTAAWGIGNVRFTGDLTNSLIAAGYEPVGGTAHSGDISSMFIGGVMDGSVLAAGIDPGDVSGGLRAGFLATGDNAEAPGVSSINRVTVRGGFANPGLSAVLADTAIDPRLVAPGVTLSSGVTAPVAGVGTEFGGSTRSITDGDLTFTLIGDGTAHWDSLTGQIILNGTTRRSSLVINNSGAATTVDVVGSDDSSLGALRTIGDVTIGDLSIDGPVNNLVADDVAPGAAWNLPGGLARGVIGDVTSPAFTFGTVRSLRSGSVFGGSITADSIGTLAIRGDLEGDLTTTMGSAGNIAVIGDHSGVASISGSAGVFRVTGDSSGSFRSRGLNRLHVGGEFDGVASVERDLRVVSVGGNLGGRVRSTGDINAVRAGSLIDGLVSASGDLRSAVVAGDMCRSYLFAGFDPGDGGYDAVTGEEGNLEIDAFSSEDTGDYADSLSGGSINVVVIRGDMGRTLSGASYVYDGAAISAGVGAGADGYLGTADDAVAGTGYIGRVRVRGGVYGSVSGGMTISSESWGVYAANEVGVVTHQGFIQPFSKNGNARVDTMRTLAGSLRITNLRVNGNSVTVYFNQPVDFGTIDSDSFQVVLSVNDTFGDGDDFNAAASAPNTLTYDATNFAVTLALTGGGTWSNLAVGDNMMILLDGSAIANNRGIILDGEYTGTFPSGNGSAGGNFVYYTSASDAADDFVTAAPISMATPVLDGGTVVFGSGFSSGSDIDVYTFAASQYDFFSANYTGSPLAKMALFYLDDQGTGADPADDYYEMVARYEYMEDPGDTLFQALELPNDGDYFLVLYPWLGDAGSYQLGLTLSSTDTNLIADLGGSMPEGEQIGYFSNELADGVAPNRNFEGFNSHKQLVYLDFDGGTTTKYASYQNVDVAAFDAATLASGLSGHTETLIYGDAGIGVTGIVDNVISIYSDIPATAGSLDVYNLDTEGWAAYEAASSGLWFTTIDPATTGYDAETDFTTVFIGEADTWGFTTWGILLGIACQIDLANMEKADNALVFAQNYAGFSTAVTLDGMLNEYSRALANTAAHELGHVLGFNHHSTSGDWLLVADDPDNDPGTPDDSNQGNSLMAYAPISEDLAGLPQLGTAPIDSYEFWIGHVDHMDQALNWLA
jgi:hypothetical protein